MVSIILIIFIILIVNANLLGAYLDNKTKYKRNISDESAQIFIFTLFFAFLFVPFPNLLKKIRYNSYRRRLKYIFDEGQLVVCCVNKTDLEIGRTYVVTKPYNKIGKCLINHSYFAYPNKYFLKENDYRRMKLKKIINKFKR
jgi:hypothetical protein